MTPIAGLIIAVIAGLLVTNGRRAASVVLVPWLVVLGYQSWDIASGRAVSPPSTVTDFPSAVAYWLAQAIILAPALGIAAQLGAFGSRRHATGISLARRAWIASALGVAASVVIILLGFVFFRHQGGTVSVGGHSTSGSSPVIGVVGILGSYLTCAALGVKTLKQRHLSKGVRATPSPQEPAQVSVSR